MNKGLRSYNKQIAQSLDGVVNGYINANKNDANLILSFPLFSVPGLNSIDVSLTFDYLSSFYKGFFGKSVRLNYYNEICNNEPEEIYTVGYDGALDEFYKSNGSYYSKETLSQLRIFKSDYYHGISAHAELEDKYGNISYYYSDNYEYPSYIKYKNGERIKLDFIAATKTISNNYGDEIRFVKKGSFITEIHHFHKNVKKLSVFLEYTNEYLTKIQTKRNNSIISEILIAYASDYISLVNNISGKTLKYNIKNGKVVSFVEGYNYNFDDGFLTTIEYNNRKTVITDRFGNKSTVLFDAFGFPFLELDSLGNVTGTQYNNKTKLLLSKTSPIQVKHKDKNLYFPNINDFDKWNVNTSPVSNIDPFFKEILGDTVYKITPLSYSARMEYSVPISGVANDQISLVIWGKQLTPTTKSSYVEVNLFAGKWEKEIFKKQIIDDNFSLMVLGVGAKRAFSSVEILIYVQGNAEIELGGIQVINKTFGSFYKYDNNHNLIATGDSSLITDFLYNNKNMPVKMVGSDSTMFNYKYNKQGNIEKIQTAYGTKILNTYHANYSNLQISSEISNSAGNNILKTKKEYTQDGRFLAKTIDEMDNYLSFNYDSYGRINSIANALHTFFKITYNDDDTISEICTKGTGSSKAFYSYDDKKRLKSITLGNGSRYTFDYDSRGNIINFYLNGKIIFNYEYDSNNNIISQKHGVDGDFYKFNYDKSGLISEIYYKKDNFKTLAYKYVYNNRKELSRVKDGNDHTIKEYYHNHDGQLVREKDKLVEIVKNYDNLGYVSTKILTKRNDKYFMTFDSLDRSKGESPESLFELYRQDNEQFIGSFLENANLYSKDLVLFPVSHTSVTPSTFVPKFDGVIPYITLDSNNLLSYHLDIKTVFSPENGSVQFWFRPRKENFNDSQCIFSCKARQGYDAINVNIRKGKVYLLIYDEKDTEQRVIIENPNLQMDQWNFFSLSFMNRHDEEDFANLCEYAININGNIERLHCADPRIRCDLGPRPVFNIGHRFKKKVVDKIFKGDVTCLFIGARRHISIEDMQKYFNLTKKYLMENQLVDSGVKTVDFSQTNLLVIPKKNRRLFDIFPLCSSALSLNEKLPKEFSLRKTSPVDKDRTFAFNNVSKKYAFVADGESSLTFDFFSGKSGTVIMRAYTDFKASKQYLFEAIDKNDKSFGLYRGDDLNLYLCVNGENINTELVFTSKVWHTVALSFSKNIVPEGYSTFEYLDFRIILDGKMFDHQVVTNINYDNLDLRIGYKTYGSFFQSDLGSVIDHFRFHGQIEMVSLSKMFGEDETILALCSKLEGISKTREYDELGMLKKIDIHKSGTSILSNTYLYKRSASNSNYISRYIEEEEIKFGFDNSVCKRKYIYNKVGDILKVTDNIFGDETYEYDYRGFLVKDKNEKIEYDDNGNITKYGNTSYAYSPYINDLLIKVGDKYISYDSKNILNPAYYDNQRFEYEGRRLTKFTTQTGLSYIYKYNDKGLRIQKDYHGIITNYSYEGDKLIHQVKDNITIDFLYDENDSLYGFLVRDVDKYFYVKDALANILGIVNEYGKLVVKYKYNAFGTILGIEGELAKTIGRMNPFRYKGYYYDEESKMYYCRSRYYVPEWGRWLNNDSPLFIKGTNSSFNNLFSYCGNNPIKNVDLDGHLFVTAFVVSMVIGAAVGAGFSILFQRETGDGEINWKKVALETSVGAIGGVIAGSGAGTLVSAVSNMALGVADSVLNDLIDSNGDLSEISARRAVASGAVGFFSGILSAIGTEKPLQIFKRLGADQELNRTITSALSANKWCLNDSFSKTAVKEIYNIYGKEIAKALSKNVHGVVAKKTAIGLAFQTLETLIAMLLISKF